MSGLVPDVDNCTLLKLRLRQIFISLGPIFLTISLGLAEGYSAILLPQLEVDPDWQIDSELSSWIASIAALPMSVGCLLGGWLMDVIGRRMLHLAVCVPNLIGWLLLALSGSDVILLLAGRFLTGMCVGVMSPVLSVYIAEASDPVFRGFLLPCLSLALNFGIAIVHILGTYIEWRLVAFLACICPITCFMLMLFVPESPTFLVEKGRIDAAKTAFRWIRGSSADTEEELDTLIFKKVDGNNLEMTLLKMFKLPEFFKPLIILIIFFAAMQLSGCNPVAFYSINIINTVLGESSIDAYMSMLIMDVVRIVASTLGCFAQRFMPRRHLMIYSCTGTIISLLALSLSSFLTVENHVIDLDLSWVILALLVAYILFLNIGLLPLPYSMAGELFSQSSRGIGNGIVTLFNMSLLFILVKITPWLFQKLQPSGVFFTFGICCLTGTILLCIWLPETKDKPLHEIEDGFKR